MNLEVVSGGPATPEEVAALTAALEVVLGGDGRDDADAQPPVSPWRWSGRRWGTSDRGRATWRR